jgi:hypothetical protein
MNLFPKIKGNRMAGQQTTALQDSKSVLVFFNFNFLKIRRKYKMASIDILSVAPHQVSRDMRGYSVFMYGG